MTYCGLQTFFLFVFLQVKKKQLSEQGTLLSLRLFIFIVLFNCDVSGFQFEVC